MGMKITIVIVKFFSFLNCFLRVFVKKVELNILVSLKALTVDKFHKCLEKSPLLIKFSF